MSARVIALASSFYGHGGDGPCSDDEIDEFVQAAKKAGCVLRVYGACHITDWVVYMSLLHEVPLVVVTPCHPECEHWHISGRTRALLDKPRPADKQPVGWSAYPRSHPHVYDIEAAAHRLVDGADILLFVPTLYQPEYELAPFAEAAHEQGIPAIAAQPRRSLEPVSNWIEAYARLVIELPLSAHAEILDAAARARRARWAALDG